MKTFSFLFAEVIIRLKQKITLVLMCLNMKVRTYIQLQINKEFYFCQGIKINSTMFTPNTSKKLFQML